MMALVDRKGRFLSAIMGTRRLQGVGGAPVETYGTGRRCLRCDCLLSQYNPDELCAPCAHMPIRRPPIPEYAPLSELQLRILICLARMPCTLLPLSTIFEEVASERAVYAAVADLETIGYVFRRVKGRGIALIGEPWRR